MSDLIERIIDIVSGLGFVVPIAIIMALGAISDNRKKKDKAKQQQSPNREPARRPEPPSTAPTLAPDSPGPVVIFPFGPLSEMTAPIPQQQATYASPARESQWGHTFDQQDEEKSGLRWGSIFEDESGERLRWESAFDVEKGTNNYGFKKINWDRSFPERSSEPYIHHE